jgi:predicted AAA+ superfamily ATPase
MHLKRNIDTILLDWKKSQSRKPLLLRGARQVGKSTSVKAFAKHFDYFLEVNFESEKDIHVFFQGNMNVASICEKLSVYYNTPIEAGKTLLFFDEIQQCIPAISSLRYFYEQLHELHLIAAGSLLEFALAELPSYGVGRIRSVFMYPLSFYEFLWAKGEGKLLDFIKNGKTIDTPFHKKITEYLRIFLIIGGMPEVVAKYIDGEPLLEIQTVLDELQASIVADFTKYKKNVPSNRLIEVFEAVVAQSGGKFNLSKASASANHGQIKEALSLLEKAGLIYGVTHSAGNGLPLGAEINDKKRKYLLLDTGIFQRILGLNIGQFLAANDKDCINKGTIAETFVGIEIIKNSNPYTQERLYYWHREAPSSNAEVDYLIQKDGQVVPVEVKASEKGSMQSLLLFMKDKNTKGIRISMENFNSFQDITIIPLYAAGYFLKTSEV